MVDPQIALRVGPRGSIDFRARPRMDQKTIECCAKIQSAKAREIQRAKALGRPVAPGVSPVSRSAGSTSLCLLRQPAKAGDRSRFHPTAVRPGFREVQSRLCTSVARLRGLARLERSQISNGSAGHRADARCRVAPGLPALSLPSAREGGRQIEIPSHRGEARISRGAGAFALICRPPPRAGVV